MKLFIPALAFLLSASFAFGQENEEYPREYQFHKAECDSKTEDMYHSLYLALFETVAEINPRNTFDILFEEQGKYPAKDNSFKERYGMINPKRVIDQTLAQLDLSDMDENSIYLLKLTLAAGPSIYFRDYMSIRSQANETVLKSIGRKMHYAHSFHSIVEKNFERVFPELRGKCKLGN